jgi:hypothetical protein
MAMFDLEKTAALDRLFQIPRDRRDAAWIAAFYQAAPEASLATGEQQLIKGPDGLPYFALYLPKPNAPFDSFCIAQVAENCLTHGVGCVINPDKTPPDWVFTYGNLWSLHSYSTFDATPPAKPQATPTAGRQVLMAAPSEQFLPAPARNVLKSYLQQVGVKEPQVLLISDAQATPTQSLAFSFYREDAQSDEQYHEVLNVLKAWFLPPHYGLVALPKSGDYEQYFVPL